MKKLLWTLTVALTSAVMAGLSVRVLERAYRRIAKEAPPEMPKWARLLVSPIKSKAGAAAQPG